MTEATAPDLPLPNERDILRRYGLTLPRYVEFLESQGGVCRVCSKPPRDGKPLVVDHDHDPPRRIWGLVHGSPCNRALSQNHRRYIRTPPAIEQYVPDDLEQATIAKRERAKLAARERRAGKLATRGKASGRGRSTSTAPTNGSTLDRIREMTRQDPTSFADQVHADETPEERYRRRTQEVLAQTAAIAAADQAARRRRERVERERVEREEREREPEPPRRRWFRKSPIYR